MLFECFQINSTIVSVHEHFACHFFEVRQPLRHHSVVFGSSPLNSPISNTEITVILNFSLKQRLNTNHQKRFFRSFQDVWKIGERELRFYFFHPLIETFRKRVHGTYGFRSPSLINSMSQCSLRVPANLFK